MRNSETDMSGNPHHSKYFVWLEESRHALLRKLGLSYRVMEEDGVFFPTVEANCRLLSPVKMDDIIEIQPKIQSANRRFVKIGYVISTREEEPQKVAEAETMHVSVNAEGKATSLPPGYLDLLKKLQQIQKTRTNARVPTFG
uniref:Acyl-CoA thioester hydrolase n=1 Tax=Candidatus Kentrum sp. SD TaxID=2126332 RepID=A0A451BRT3_9GAMM|nr:MAG: acyl-CoA thioester hydrolase [Candidatus Kentron sp. SD]